MYLLINNRQNHFYIIFHCQQNQCMTIHRHRHTRIYNPKKKLILNERRNREICKKKYNKTLRCSYRIPKILNLISKMLIWNLIVTIKEFICMSTTKVKSNEKKWQKIRFRSILFKWIKDLFHIFFMSIHHFWMNGFNTLNG